MKRKSDQKNRENPGKTIHLSRIPANENYVPDLMRFYKRHGHIISIWCDGTEATIEYETPESAKRALEDPEPFMNNRFIQLEYHINPEKAESHLEQFCDLNRVQKFENEVNSAIDEKIRETFEIQNELRAKTNQILLSPENQAKLQELKMNLAEYRIESSGLKIKRKQVSKNEAAIIDERLCELNALKTETEILIRQLQPI